MVMEFSISNQPMPFHAATTDSTLFFIQPIADLPTSTSTQELAWVS